MDYKQHTKQRFNEKFTPMIQNKNLDTDWVEFTDDDYTNICNLCRDNGNYLYSKVDNHSIGKKGKYAPKVVIFYRGVYMWCIISKKKKIVKTIYPADRADRRKLSCSALY